MKTRTAVGRTLFSAVSILIACLAARTAAANLDLTVATPSPVDRVGAAPGAGEAATAIGNWEVFTDGRMGGFASYVRGDGWPPDTFVTDPVTMMPVRTQVPFGGGISVNQANPAADPSMPNLRPTLESWRIRSGFLGNIFGVGFRYRLTPWTTLTAYLQYWADIESESRRKYTPMPVDARQGYARVEGLWGTVTVGRQLTLFSRGAVEIDFLYGHGYSMGFPTAIDSNGPAAGHIGTGVLGPGFAGGIMYSTPKMAGVQLNVSVFDPVALQGAWDRTKEPRPEAELTYDLGWGNGKLHLFANGAYQRVYRIGEPDSTNEAAYGVGGGARVEAGPVHVGFAGHWGQGLGTYYALETTEAAYDASAAHRLRKSFGLYGQAQVSIRKFDVNAGVGYAGVTPLPQQTVTINSATGPMTITVPADGTPDAYGLRQSLIKGQLGISGVVVYHVNPHLHLSADYFRAMFTWQLGETQNVNFASAGMILTW